jgi:hypothetical protein
MEGSIEQMFHFSDMLRKASALALGLSGSCSGLEPNPFRL